MPLRKHSRAMPCQLSMNVDSSPAFDEADLSLKVRLVTLRSPEVPWYYGPDKHEDDVREILSSFRTFVETHPRWKLTEANETG